MSQRPALTLVLTCLFLIFSASCRESTRTGANNAADSQNSRRDRNVAPINANVMNHNSTNANTLNANTMMNHTETTLGEEEDSPGMTNLTSSPNAAAQPFDLQFIDSMIQHHQGAIVMAKMVLAKSQNQELRAFAEHLILDQEAEIEKLEELHDIWYPAEPEAINMEMPGMGETMKMMTGERMDRLESAAGRDFEIQFLEMMTAHHGGGVKMSKLAVEKVVHEELKTFAQGILQKQEKEIRQLQGWKEEWAKKS